jgi:periplasmic protein CpxP/Spy
MKTLRITVLTAMVGFASLAFAQGGGAAQGEGQGQGEHQGMHRQMPSVDDQVNRLDKQLNLSDEQKTQVRSILQSQHDKMQQLFQDSSADPQDRRAKMREVHESTNNQIRSVLNDDQKKQFDQLEQEQQQRRQSRMREGMNRE